MSNNEINDDKNLREATPETEFTNMDFDALDELEKLHDIEKNKDVKFFDRDSKFNIFMNKFGTFIFANLLFILCSLPIITIGASLTALNSTMLQFHKHDDIKVASIFFSSFKENFFKATIGFIISTGVFTMGLDGLWVGLHAGPNPIELFFIVLITGVMMFVSLCFFTFYFALLARYDNDILSQVKNAFFIGLAYVRWGFVIWLIWILVIGFFVIEPILFIFFGFVWIMFGFAVLVYQTLKIHIKVFRLVGEKAVTDDINYNIN